MRPPVIRLNGISESSANSRIRITYFFRFFVWKYPSTIRNAKIGKDNLPMHVSTSFLMIPVPHKWSHSISVIASTCNEKEVISNFMIFFIIHPFISIFTNYFSELKIIHCMLSFFSNRILKSNSTTDVFKFTIIYTIFIILNDSEIYD